MLHTTAASPLLGTFVEQGRELPVEDAPLRIAYLSLQQVVEGQDSWAAVTEVIRGWRAMGWTVDEYSVRYVRRKSPGPLTRVIVMARLQLRLGRLLRGYDAVYVRGHPFALQLTMSARRKSVPIVQECNGLTEDLFLAWPQARPLRPLIEWMQRWQYRHCDAAIAVTPELAKWITHATGQAQVSVSPNAANSELFSPDRARLTGLPPRYAVFFGQFAPWQGITTLLAATTTDEWPADVSLVVAGDGVLRPEVQTAAESHPERVVYLGKLNYGDTGSLAAHSIASFVPMVSAKRDSAGLSPLKLFESMAAGVPVIATDTPGLADIVREEQCGVVVGGGDPHALAAALAELAREPEKARRMGERGREAAVHRHSWDSRARERGAVLRKVVPQHRARES